MRYPMIPKSAKAGTPFEGICNDCRRRDIAIYRARSSAARAPQALPQLRPLKAPDQAQAEQVDYDILLDALSFLGRGTWAKFQALLEYWAGAERHPREVARELFLLGFLDLEVRPGTNSIRAWCVPQASVNFTGPDTAYLSGFRSKDLLVALETVTRSLNGELVVSSMPGRPALVQLQRLHVADAAAALAGMRDPLGRPVLVNTEPAQRLARACLALEGIEACLRPVSIARSKDLQHLDLQRMKWVPTDNTARTGAYRWNHGIQLYALVRAQGDAVSGPYQVIKLLAAKQAGMQLHQYNRSAGAFLSTLGCEPPGLLERALVAAAGELPAIGRGIVSYKSVPSEVAAAILSTMYPEIRAEHEASKSYQRI